MRRVLLAFFSLLFSTGIVFAKHHNNQVTQFNVTPALAVGVYQTGFTVKDVLRYGDQAMGVADRTGVMVGLDSKLYKSNNFGVELMNAKAPIAWAIATKFKPNVIEHVESLASLADIQSTLLASYNRPNQIIPWRIHGDFDLVMASEPDSSENPHPVEKSFKKISGTLVGFYIPKYLYSISIPGFHAHFLADDQSVSGAVSSACVHQGKLELDTGVKQYQIVFPQGNAQFNQEVIQ